MDNTMSDSENSENPLRSEAVDTNQRDEFIHVDIDFSDEPSAKKIRGFKGQRQQVLSVLSQSRWVLRNVPKVIFKKRSVRGLSQACRTTLLKLVDRVVRRFCRVLFSSDGDALYNEYIKQKCFESGLVTRIARAVKKAKRGSLEKRVLRASLFSSVPSSALFRLLTGREMGEDREAGDLTSESSWDSEDEDEVGEPESDLFTTDSEATVDMPNFGGEQGASQAFVPSTRARRRNGYMVLVQKSSRDDWMVLMEKGYLPRKHYSRQHFHDFVIHSLVTFIFRADNAQLMSWGTTRIKCHGSYYRFPAIRRKGTIDSLWEKYNLELGMNSGVSRVGRTTFVRIVTTLTRGAVRERQCVDYYQYELVHSNFSNLKEMVRKEAINLSTEQRADINKKIDGVGNYLKYTYQTHLVRSGGDPAHCMQFAMHGDGDQERAISCRECASPFHLIAGIRRDIGHSNDHLCTVLDNASEKVRLYMAHKVRCSVQETRQQEIFDDVRTSKPRTQAVVLLDYKMKFVPKRFRESSNLWFAQAGMTWHGAAIFSRKEPAEYEREEDIRRAMWERKKRRRQYVPGHGSDVPSDEYGLQLLDVMFTDTIVGNTNTQNIMQAVQIFESVCIRIRHQLPLVEKINVVTDNASVFKSVFFALMAYRIAEHHGILLESVFHPEAQDSKTPIDAHFAVSARHVEWFIRRVCGEVIVPSDLVNALIYAGGVKCTATDFIHVDVGSVWVQTWLDQKAKNQIFDVGSRGEFVFTRVEKGAVHVAARTYANGPAEDFLLTGHTLKVWDKKNETVEQCISRDTIDIPPPLVDAQGRKRRGRPRRMQKVVPGNELSSDEESGKSDCDELILLEQSANDEPEIDLSGGVSEHPNFIDFTQFQVRHKGVSGVSVKYMSDMHQWDRRVHLEYQTAMEDIVAEMGVEEELVVADCGDAVSEGGTASEAQPLSAVAPRGGDDPNSAVQGGQVEAEQVCIEGDQALSTDRVMVNSLEKTVFSCDKCGKVYRHQNSLVKHRRKCAGPDKDRDALSRAVDMALDGVLRGNEFNIYSRDDENPFTQLSEHCDGEHTELLRGSWAKPAKQGETLGFSTIPKYREYIDMWFQRSKDNQDERMSAAMMHRALQSMFPDRYDIPGEYNIRSILSSMRTSAKRRERKAAVKQAKRQLAVQGNEENNTPTPQRQLSTQRNDDIGASGAATTARVAGTTVPVTQTESQPERSSASQDPCLPTESDFLDEYIPLAQSLPPDYGGEVERGGTHTAFVSGEDFGVLNSDPLDTEPKGKMRGTKAAMKKEYADAILALLVEQPSLKRCFIRSKMIERLGLNPDNLPDDFPDQRTVARKYSNFKNSMKSGNQRASKSNART